jgi:tetratricopeptide (TPR) repeat protein
MRHKIFAGALLFCMAGWLGHSPAWAQQQQPGGYTRQEYDAYQAAVNEKNAQQRIKLLDDFVAKYPQSELMIYLYRPYYLGYYELKNFPKAIEYSDKLLAQGEKVDVNGRLEALAARAQAFFLGSNQRALLTPEQLTKTQQAAAEGLKVVSAWPKPEAMTEEQYKAQIRSLNILFNSIGGIASQQLKDYTSAITYFRAAIALDPSDARSHYLLGLSYLQHNSAQHLDGFWSLARAIALKVPNDNQVRTYLRNQMMRYQQPQCDAELDKQVTELLALAAASADRPESYKFYSFADLEKARENVATFMDSLKAGGEPAKLTWLSVCGLEFPDVAVKVIETAEPASATDPIVMKVCRASTPEELEACAAANMEIKVTDQPDAKRVTKDSYVRFTGTLSGYQPEPFMLFWDKAKINAEDIPEAKPEAPAKKTTKKAPTKRPPTKGSTQ